MSDRNDTVMINLGGEPYELRFGHKALKAMLASMNKNLEDLEVNGNNMEEVEKVMYFGLMSHCRKKGIDLKLEDMEDLLDEAESYGDVINKITLAINKAFDQASIDEANLQQVAQARKKKAQ